MLDVPRLALARDQAERAARLLGAADALKTRLQSPLRPVERAFYDRTLATARAALGAAAFAAAWAEGQAMTLEQAIDTALTEKVECPGAIADIRSYLTEEASAEGTAMVLEDVLS